MKTSADIRQLFLDYFAGKGHEVVESSPLVPANDPTLLFTNAGMVQFKDVFLGNESRKIPRATSTQRCVRAGGKHNDLENVGYTARHHTFFEMLGNFSFGDYFKREAIQYAWEFLTVSLALPPEKLWVTVFEEDEEAADIWLNEVGISADRFSRIGAKDNFWSMGDTGPCGPCSEIFYDHGEEVAGGPPGSPEEDGDRYIEIWNLVFMQFDRSADGTLTPLPKPSVDTGMGLERLAAVLQGKHNNYDIDLFQNLITAIVQLAGIDDTTHTSARVIADHIRSCAFMITDGVQPSNEGRGYVLRRIIRRAIRHGHKLGLKQAFFHKLVAPLVNEMGDAFPELVKAQPLVERALALEEERFADTLDNGLKILDQAIDAMADKEIPGETVFLLYDTYGFPIDLTADIARERNLTIDIAGFERHMEAQRNRARNASQFAGGLSENLIIDGETVFCGYDHTRQEATIMALLVDGENVNTLEAGQTGIIVLDHTPFYAESGGQVGDKGEINSAGAHFSVMDTRKQGKAFAHMGECKHGQFEIGQQIIAHVDESNRQATALNHSATHLLHAALRQVLGDHVNQKGSLVNAQRLRFDFSHYEAVSAEQVREIERLVNQQIRINHTVETRLMPLEKARDCGAMALFGEKYDDEVRVLSMGEFSIELCGGTHVGRTGDIGLFKIINEAGIASGVRRIEAVTGDIALDIVEDAENRLSKISDLVKAKADNVEEKTLQLVQKNRQLEKELESLKAKLASSAGQDMANEAIDIHGVKVLAAKLDGVDVKALRDAMDQLKNKLGDAVIVLANVSDDKITLIAGVTKAQTEKVRAGDLVAHVAKQVGGKGGGRPDMAQGGGNQPENLSQALDSVAQWVTDKLEA
ncbi:Alanyl-tRNA synthetase [Methylophaga frappieri]|uniref:Alanine--tRNA ligase n=1 Tax=Methylophaga frappieri (strain ATCC BAA-2434 / DSM 25690 / JAM7) TaxID=754477 RepID=I1YER0_METFJ|nr:alanine--tRNA ligase [Methylophaga frappieri]AFJ01403.1 Alanyl-tRNA synthetase [Methylophaga frappieri]